MAIIWIFDKRPQSNSIFRALNLKMRAHNDGRHRKKMQPIPHSTHVQTLRSFRPHIHPPPRLLQTQQNSFALIEDKTD